MVLFSKGWNIEFGTLWATWDDKLTDLEGWSLEETIRRVLWEQGCWSLEVTMIIFLKGWDFKDGTILTTWGDELTDPEGWSLEETIRRVLWEFGCWSLEVTMTRFLKGWDIIVVDEPRAWKFTNRS